MEGVFRDSCSWEGAASNMHYCMGGGHDGLGHVTNARRRHHRRQLDDGSVHVVVAVVAVVAAAIAGHREGPYLKRNDMPKKRSNTQNGHPNLMRRCPSLSMRSSLREVSLCIQKGFTKTRVIEFEKGGKKKSTSSLGRSHRVVCKRMRGR